MSYWKKSRNYRKRTNTDGTARYIITVDGTDVEVTAEVYLAYSQADRRERYAYEREEGVLLSLERMTEDNMPLGHYSDKPQRSFGRPKGLGLCGKYARSHHQP